jgi:hypothetical protein
MKGIYKNLTILLTIIILLVNPAITDNEAGARIGVSQNFITYAEEQFLPDFINTHRVVPVPPQNITDGGLVLNLSDIELHLGHYNIGDVKLTLVEPNRLHVSAKNLTGDGSFKVTAKYRKLPAVSDNVQIIIQRIDLDAEILIDEIDSDIPGKKMPNIQITYLNLPVNEFDFNMSGIIGFLAELVKDVIKAFVRNNITSIAPFLNTQISQMIKQLPVYFDLPVDPLKDYALDISLTSPFKILANQTFVLSGNGSFVNEHINATKNTQFPVPTMLPYTDPEGKDIQVFLTDYFLNTAFNTLYLSDMIKYNVTQAMIPNTTDIKLNTGLLDIVFNGLAEKYGSDKDAQIMLTATKAPIVELDKDLSLKAGFNFSIQVEKSKVGNTTIFEEAIAFNSDLGVKADFSLLENGKIESALKSLAVTNSTLYKQSGDYGVSVETLQGLINLGGKIGLSMVNDMLKNITIDLSKIPKVDISNSTASIKQGYIEVTTSPKFLNSSNFITDAMNVLNDFMKAGYIR